MGWPHTHTQKRLTEIERYVFGFSIEEWMNEYTRQGDYFVSNVNI